MTFVYLNRYRNVFFLPALSILRNPFSILVFLYFFFSSADCLNVPLFIFKAKLTNIIALFFGSLILFFSKTVQVPKLLFSLGFALLICIYISLWNSPSFSVCFAFSLFFFFNFIFYFFVTFNLFRFFDENTLFRLYSWGFYFTGFYAFCQVVFSLAGIRLPGLTQYIAGMGRGTALTYEPSFYALYMTPFAIYSTSKFLLQNSSKRKIREVFWPNLLLLISTSTGVVFSYLFFIFFLLIFRALKILKRSEVTVRKLFFNFVVVVSALVSMIFILNKHLITSGFLKFFYAKGVHFSIQDRWRGLVEYWDVFLEHPLVGVGLGSGPLYIAEKQFGYAGGQDPWILSLCSPMNVTTEVLASLGLLGAVTFLLFFYALIKIFRSTLKISDMTQEQRITFLALALSVCVMFSTLQFSQSIMRCYLWIHLGIFCGYASYLRERYSRVSLLTRNANST